MCKRIEEESCTCAHSMVGGVNHDEPLTVVNPVCPLHGMKGAELERFLVEGDRKEERWRGGS